MSMQDTEQDDELSFGDFKQQLQQLRLFLRGLFRLTFRNVRRYWALLLLLLIGCAALGHYKYKQSKVFEARTSYIYTELHKKTYGEMIDKLQEMIRVGSYNRLSDALQLSSEQARAVVGLRAENIFGAKLSEDITEDKKQFYITVIATNNTVFDTLQQALENYLNNNPQVKKKTAWKRKVLLQKIAYEEAELAMLDSLKAAYTKSLDKPSSALHPAATPFDPVQLYEKGEKINQDLADMKVLLEDQRSVQTLDKFMVPEEPAQKALSFTLKYLALFVIASIALLFILSIVKK